MNQSTKVESHITRRQQKFLKLIEGNKNIYQHFQKNEQPYMIKKQTAQYSTFEDFEKSKPIIFLGCEDRNRRIFAIFSALIPDNQMDRFLLYFVKLVGPHQDSPFIIIFFNTDYFTGSKLSSFRSFYRELPMPYFYNCENIFIVHASFVVKSGDYFVSDWYLNYLQSKTIYKDTIQKLSSEDWFVYDLIEQLPQYIQKADKTFRDVVKNKDKLKQINRDGVQIDKTKSIFGLLITDYKLNSYGIPIIFDVLISYFMSNQQYMTTEGIFRIQSSSSEEIILDQLLANKQYFQITQISEPSVVAGVLKKFFHLLKQPIIPFTFYDSMKKKIQNKMGFEFMNELKQVLDNIPKTNKLVLLVLFGFLRKIASFETSNKMGVYNLAVCFAPTLMRPEKYQADDLQAAGALVKVIEFALRNYRVLFGENENFVTYLEQNLRSQSLEPLPEQVNMNDFDNLEPCFNLIEKSLVENEEKMNDFLNQKVQTVQTENDEQIQRRQSHE